MSSASRTTSLYPGGLRAAPASRTLAAAGAELVQRTRQQRHELSMLVLQCPDLQELEALFGKSAAMQAVDEVLTHLARVAGSLGRVFRTRRDTFTLLMPRLAPSELLRALRGRLGPAMSIELGLHHDDVVLMPEVSVCAITEDATLDEVYEVLCQELENERRATQARLHYLTQERRSHTWPMALSHRDVDDAVTQFDEGAYAANDSQPATYPAPIAA